MSASDPEVRILLADDHNLVRAGIRALLENIGGTRIVAEADNGRDAVALALEHRPDLAVLDVSMRELNGVEAAGQIVAQSPGTRVLMLSMHASEEFVRRALKAGASGYLVKDSVPLELEIALRAVMRGELYLSPRVTKPLVSGLMEGATEAGTASLEALSARQREILQLIAEGKSTREMAALLGVSHKTIEAHRTALMHRLGIFDVAGLVVFAARNRLIPIDTNESGGG